MPAPLQAVQPRPRFGGRRLAQAGEPLEPVPAGGPLERARVAPVARAAAATWCGRSAAELPLAGGPLERARVAPVGDDAAAAWCGRSAAELPLAGGPLERARVPVVLLEPRLV